ncbi:hypothetical protein EDD15DRAFT_15711 [Pisolithus albus]|nr:hypothetical protein EDD15DRAFT_15711 [Pisolithus albus]
MQTSSISHPELVLPYLGPLWYDVPLWLQFDLYFVLLRAVELIEPTWNSNRGELTSSRARHVRTTTSIRLGPVRRYTKLSVYQVEHLTHYDALPITCYGERWILWPARSKLKAICLYCLFSKSFTEKKRTRSLFAGFRALTLHNAEVWLERVFPFKLLNDDDADKKKIAKIHNNLIRNLSTNDKHLTIYSDGSLKDGFRKVGVGWVGFHHGKSTRRPTCSHGNTASNTYMPPGSDSSTLKQFPPLLIHSPPCPTNP